MKYVFKLAPFALVILLCLISQPAVNVGRSENNSGPTIVQSVDGVWTDVTKSGTAVSNNMQTGPRAYRSFKLNATRLTTILAAAPLEFRDGYLMVPTTPGLGVELHEAACAKFPYQHVDMPIFSGSMNTRGVATGAAVVGKKD